MQATLEFCQERLDAVHAEEMVSCLAALPSRGLLTDPSSAVGPSGRLYLCLHNTDPPGGKVLQNAPCSLADLYRNHHAKLQQQERPPLKRKAQNQLPDLRPPPAMPTTGGHLAIKAAQQQQQQGGGQLQLPPSAAGAMAHPRGRLLPQGPQQFSPRAQQQQQQQQHKVVAGPSGRGASHVTRTPHTPSPGVVVPPNILTPAPRCPLGGRTPTQQLQQQAGSGGGGGSADHRHIAYSLEQLNGMVLKDLGGLCAARGLPTSGRKADLVRRLMEYQRRLQRAQRPSS